MRSWLASTPWGVYARIVPASIARGLETHVDDSLQRGLHLRSIALSSGRVFHALRLVLKAGDSASEDDALGAHESAAAVQEQACWEDGRRRPALCVGLGL